MADLSSDFVASGRCLSRPLQDRCGSILVTQPGIDQTSEYLTPESRLSRPVAEAESGSDRRTDVEVDLAMRDRLRDQLEWWRHASERLAAVERSEVRRQSRSLEQGGKPKCLRSSAQHRRDMKHATLAPHGAEAFVECTGTPRIEAVAEKGPCELSRSEKLRTAACGRIAKRGVERGENRWNRWVAGIRIELEEDERDPCSARGLGLRPDLAEPTDGSPAGLRFERPRASLVLSRELWLLESDRSSSYRDAQINRPTSSIEAALHSEGFDVSRAELQQTFESESAVGIDERTGQPQVGNAGAPRAYASTQSEVPAM